MKLTAVGPVITTWPSWRHLDAEHTAVEPDLGVPIDKTPARGGHGCGAGGGAAGPGYAGSTLPHAQAQPLPIGNGGDTDIDPARKQGVVLDGRAERRQIDRV